MRLDAANRAFAALLGLCAGTFALVGVAACNYFPMIDTALEAS